MSRERYAHQRETQSFASEKKAGVSHRRSICCPVKNNMLSSALLMLALCHVSRASQKGPPGLMTTAVQPQHTARIGENFRFLCPIRADPEPIFEWYRDGNRIPGHWERYKFLNRGNTLSIQRLECEDEGTYTCKGINGFGAQQINFQLTLLDGSSRHVCKEGSEDDDLLGRPEILHKKPKRWLKPAGNYALLRCTAIGDPLPRFQWFKEGIEILQDKGLASISAKYVIRSTVLGEDDLRHANAVEGMKSTLQISDLRGSDTANYTCRAINEHGSDEVTQFLDVVEPQTPRRPEFYPEHPPSNTFAEVGQGGSLSCKVLSDFKPEIHWLKRITVTPGTFQQPKLPSAEEVESFQSQFVPNGTITIGDIIYQILPSAPASSTSSTNDVYNSILLLPKRLQESDAGYYICLAFNNAGYNFRQAYLNVTRSRNIPLLTNADDYYPYDNKYDEQWNNERNRNEALTTAVVVVTVVVCGVAGMIVSCFVWKRRKNHLRDKTLSLPSCAHLSSQQPLPSPAPPTNYIAFREGLTNSSFGTPSPILPGSNPSSSRTYYYHHDEHRLPYSQARPSESSPRQPKVYPGRVTSSHKSGSSRTSRQSPRTRQLYLDQPAESRSLTNDSSYSDAVARHTRLPYPSPETSFD